MTDLKLIFNTTYTSLSRSIGGRGAGGFIGAVVGAIIVDKYENHLDICIGVSTTLAAVFLSAIPFVPNVNYVWLLFCANGCLSGIVNIAGTRAALKMWKGRSSPVLQMLHMGFGVGALSAPLICSPFLASLSTSPEITQPGIQKFTIIKPSNIEHAFLLIGLFTFAVSLPFYVFQFRKSRRSQKKYVGIEHEQKTKQKTLRQLINPGTYANGNFRFGSQMLILLSIYFINLVGGEKVIASFVRTFAVDVYKFGKTQSSLLNTGFWISLTFGRLIGAIISHFIPVRKLFATLIVLHLCSATLLYQYAFTGPHIYTVLILAEGFLTAPLYPLGIAYGNSLIDITGVSLMVIVFAGSLGDMVYLWLAGWMYDNYGPKSMYNMSTLAAVILVLCVVLFISAVRRRKEKYPDTMPECKIQKQEWCI